MRRLLVATRNRGKQAEFRVLLAPLHVEVLFPNDIGLSESSEEQSLEAFETFHENARSKAEWFLARTGLPTLADDSGVEVDALGGAPGVYSRRFAGVDGPDHEVAGANNAELLRRLAGVEAAARTARYRGVLVLCRPGVSELVVEGVTEGMIALGPRGSGGFGYDPLFISTELEKTFGEASPEEKEGVSHRARAARALLGRLRGRD
jgi:XTP/dITP diphosphohydrolase